MFLKLGSIGTPFSHRMTLGILWREGAGVRSCNQIIRGKFDLSKDKPVRCIWRGFFGRTFQNFNMLRCITTFFQAIIVYSTFQPSWSGHLYQETSRYGKSRCLQGWESSRKSEMRRAQASGGTGGMWNPHSV